MKTPAAICIKAAMMTRMPLQLTFTATHRDGDTLIDIKSYVLAV